MLSAMHIATRGRLDGEYGIATRGYLVCPDIVPRYPDGAIVRSPLERFAELRRIRSWAATIEEHPDWYALNRELDWGARVGQPRVEAEAVERNFEAQVRIVQVVGETQDEALAGQVGDDKRIGVMSTEDAEGILEGSGLLGDVRDDVPHC